MKHDTISLQRRYLLIAGLAGIAAPSALFASRDSHALRGAAGFGHRQHGMPTIAGSGNNAEKMVVSGRILRADGKPFSGITIEARNTTENGDLAATTTTDADGRFMLTMLAPGASTGRRKYLLYRVNDEGRQTPIAHLHFAHASGDSSQNVTQLQCDETGILRAAIGLTLV